MLSWLWFKRKYTNHDLNIYPFSVLILYMIYLLPICVLDHSLQTHISYHSTIHDLSIVSSIKIYLRLYFYIPLFVYSSDNKVVYFTFLWILSGFCSHINFFILYLLRMSYPTFRWNPWFFLSGKKQLGFMKRNIPFSNIAPRKL